MRNKLNICEFQKLKKKQYCYFGMNVGIRILKEFLNHQKFEIETLRFLNVELETNNSTI